MNAIVAVVLASGLGAAPVDLGAAKKEAAASAEAWVALVDAGSTIEAWRSASATFRSGVTSEEWARALRGAREPLGAAGARKQLSARFTETMPGAPDGSYVVVTYGTSFAKKQDATETVIVVQDPDGKWRVSGYWIH